MSLIVRTANRLENGALQSWRGRRIVHATRTNGERSPQIFHALGRELHASFGSLAWCLVLRSPVKSGLSRIKKGAAGCGGRAGRARTRSGDGEGWGRDRGRVVLSLA